MYTDIQPYAQGINYFTHHTVQLVITDDNGEICKETLVIFCLIKPIFHNYQVQWDMQNNSVKGVHTTFIFNNFLYNKVVATTLNTSTIHFVLHTINYHIHPMFSHEPTLKQFRSMKLKFYHLYCNVQACSEQRHLDHLNPVFLLHI